MLMSPHAHRVAMPQTSERFRDNNYGRIDARDSFLNRNQKFVSGLHEFDWNIVSAKVNPRTCRADYGCKSSIAPGRSGTVTFAVKIAGVISSSRNSHRFAEILLPPG
jgi:hypothetical protein